MNSRKNIFFNAWFLISLAVFTVVFTGCDKALTEDQKAEKDMEAKISFLRGNYNWTNKAIEIVWMSPAYLSENSKTLNYMVVWALDDASKLYNSKVLPAAQTTFSIKVTEIPDTGHSYYIGIYTLNSTSKGEGTSFSDVIAVPVKK